MLDKKYNTNGQKDYQRNDSENRSLDYRKYLRTFENNGFFMDIDFLKFRGDVPVAITEITRCDSPEITDSYLKAIEERFFFRDKQGEIIKKIKDLLHVPAYLILYQKDLLWFQIFSFQVYKWRKMNPQEFQRFIQKL